MITQYLDLITELCARVRRSPGHNILVLLMLTHFSLSASAGSPHPISSTTANSKELIAEAASIDKPTPLTLALVIDRALTRNTDVLDARLALRTSEIGFENAWDTMYMPTLSLSLNSTSEKSLFHVGGTSTDPNQRERGYPASSIGITLGQYTLYNFGRDKLTYEMSRIQWDRQKQVFEELKRTVKFNVIIAYWNLKSAVDQLEAYERSVEIASAVLELQKSRVPLARATETDVSSSNVDLLNAKNLRDSAKRTADEALLNLNVLIGDPVGSKYLIEEEITFLPIAVTEEMLFETYMKESPNMKTARTNFSVQQLNLEKVQKDILPLPKIQFSGVTVAQANNYYDRVASQSGVSTTSNGNFDISTGVTLTIPLTGPGGLFNRRSVELASIALEQSEMKVRTTANGDRSQIIQLVQGIHQLEETVLNNRLAYKSSISVLQSVFDSVMSHGIVSRLDIRDALTQARDSEISLSQALVQHLNNKTKLAAFIGVDYLPRIK